MNNYNNEKETNIMTNYPIDGALAATEGAFEIDLLNKVTGTTYPDLGVFYSGTDKVSGAARAASSPVCIFVCDPIRKKMLGSIGKDFAEAEIIVFSRGTAPQEDLSEDKRLIPPTDEIVRLASQCLRTRSYAGDIRLHTRIDGRGCLKIKLVIPKARRE